MPLSDFRLTVSLERTKETMGKAEKWSVKIEETQLTMKSAEKGFLLENNQDRQATKPVRNELPLRIIFGKGSSTK